jgi:hypothetical protein
MAEYTPVFSTGGAPISMTTSAAVVGGRLVEVTNSNTVGPAGAASVKVLGVAAFDQAIVGAKVDVWPLPGVVHETTASGAVAAGDNLAAGAAGVVSPIAAGTFGQLVGVAVAAAADTAICRYLGR